DYPLQRGPRAGEDSASGGTSGFSVCCDVGRNHRELERWLAAKPISPAAVQGNATATAHAYAGLSRPDDTPVSAHAAANARQGRSSAYQQRQGSKSGVSA